MDRYNSKECKGCGNELIGGAFGSVYLGFNYFGEPHERDGFYCGGCYTAIKTAEKGPTPEERAEKICDQIQEDMRQRGVVTTAHYEIGVGLIADAIREAVERALNGRPQ
jgi:hypothetical protein